jgi:hypothetical protein
MVFNRVQLLFAEIYKGSIKSPFWQQSLREKVLEAMSKYGIQYITVY